MRGPVRVLAFQKPPYPGAAADGCPLDSLDAVRFGVSCEDRFFIPFDDAESFVRFHLQGVLDDAYTMGVQAERKRLKDLLGL